jgi:hypothetical protein
MLRMFALLVMAATLSDNGLLSLVAVSSLVMGTR